MKIFLLVLAIFVIYKFIKGWYDFKGIKENMEYYFFKLEQEKDMNQNNPLFYARRGSRYQSIQDFPKANKDFQKALSLIEEGMPAKYEDKNIKIDKEFIDDLKNNIHYTIKPLPWLKNGPSDLSNSSITYSLITLFGNRRRSF